VVIYQHLEESTVLWWFSSCTCAGKHIGSLTAYLIFSSVSQMDLAVLLSERIWVGIASYLD